MPDRVTAKIISALAEAPEPVRREIAALLVLPQAAAERRRQRDAQLRELRRCLATESDWIAAQAIAEDYRHYLSTRWKRDQAQSLLPYSTTRPATIFLHRIARLNEGKSITSRQILRIIENQKNGDCDIEVMEMSETRL